MGYCGPVGMEAFAKGDEEAALEAFRYSLHGVIHGPQSQPPHRPRHARDEGAGQKISMLYVTTLDEAAAADAAGIDMLSIESRFFSPEMREAAGRCFVQVGLPFGPYGDACHRRGLPARRLPLHRDGRRLLLLRGVA